MINIDRAFAAALCERVVRGLTGALSADDPKKANFFAGGTGCGGGAAGGAGGVWVGWGGVG